MVQHKKQRSGGAAKEPSPASFPVDVDEARQRAAIGDGLLDLDGRLKSSTKRALTPRTFLTVC